MKLVFATNNAHKLAEAADILDPEIIILGLKDINCFDEIPETADTLAGNALMKARFVKQKYGMDCFSDDTGLEVEALDNAPGVFSARYAGPEQNPQANVDKLLREMEGKENRKAGFRTVVALILGTEEYLFEGEVRGRIIKERRGGLGFGYDPVFMPEGHEQTFAELSSYMKNAISHRAVAMRKLSRFLSSLKK